MTNTEKLANILKNHGVIVSEETMAAFSQAFNGLGDPASAKILNRKRDKLDLSLFYTLNMGPSIALPDPKKSGRQGSVKKHVAVNTGEVFAFKTLVMKEERDFIRFKREHDALEALGLLKDVVWPKKIGDKGRLAFPFHEGESFHDYVNRYTKIEKDIEIALLIIEEVKKIHDKGYAHNSLHKFNILIDEKERDIRVHLIDYGRCLPKRYYLGRDHKFLSDILAMLFEYIDHYPQSVIKQIRGLIAKMDASTYLELDTITEVLKQAKLERDLSMSDKPVTPTASSLMIYTEASNALLDQHQLVLSPETRQAHERAFAQHPESTKPIHRKSDNVDLSLFNLPGIGPSIPFQNSKGRGWRGSVRKHLAVSGKIFALKTIKINNPDDLQLFRQEHDALADLGLLEGVEWPQKVGDKGRLAFTFYEGITLEKYMQDHGKINNGIEMLLLILDAVKNLHSQGYAHRDLWEGNIIVRESADNMQVHLVDFGQAQPLDAEGVQDDIGRFKGLIRFIFNDCCQAFTTTSNMKDYFKCSTYKECSERLIALKGGWTTTLDEMRPILTLAKITRDNDSFDHLHFTQLELTEYLLISIGFQWPKLTEELARRLVKDFGAEALNKKDAKGKTLLEHAAEMAKLDSESTSERILQEAAAPLSYTSASPSVVSFSAQSDDASDLTSDEKKKFHFFATCSKLESP